MTTSTRAFRQSATAVPRILLATVLLSAWTALSPGRVLAQESRVVIGEPEAGDSYAVRAEPIRVLEGASVPGSVQSRGGDVTLEALARVARISTRDGNVEVGPNAWTGSVATRGGDIRLLADAEVEGEVATRGGDVEIQTGGSIRGSISTRGGDVRLHPGGEVSGNLRTRYGGIAAETGASVQGSLVTRHGTISLGNDVVVRSVRTRTGAVTLRGARVILDLDSSGGDVDIGEGSVVEGNLIVLMDPSCDFPGWFSDPRIPVVRIDGTSQVLGRVVIDERAHLEVAQGAALPEIERYESRADFECPD